nr:MAG TPA: hypothetical protein [Bacteriophage sp.]
MTIPPLNKTAFNPCVQSNGAQDSCFLLWHRPNPRCPVTNDR